MSGFPTVNFGEADAGLFTPEEIARLMESEFQRAVRYGFPLTVLCVEIDRLEALHDLYGVESEQRILRAVGALLRSSTRGSDALGVLLETRLRMLLPHTSRAAAAAVARRLLAGCRELDFRGEGRTLRASLSIGSAAHAEESSLQELTQRAEEALEVALAGGGDRHVEFERLQARSVAARTVVPAPPPVRASPRGARTEPLLPTPDELRGQPLEEQVRTLLARAGGGALGAFEQQVLAILQSTLAEASRPRATRAEVLAEIRVLEQRVAEQKRLLEASEEELARLVREKSVDPGVASLYKSVQGLDPATPNFQKKRDLLAVIYQANLELLRQLEREAGGG